MDDIRISEAEHGPADDRRYEYVPTYILRGLHPPPPGVHAGRRAGTPVTTAVELDDQSDRIDTPAVPGAP